MQIWTAAGVALAWGLLAGIVHATLFSGVEFASAALLVRYAATCALLAAAVCVPAGVAAHVGAWLLAARLGPERRRSIALVAAQVTALLIPPSLVVLHNIQRGLPHWVAASSPTGLAWVGGVALATAVLGIVLTLGLASLLGKAGFRGLALAGAAGLVAAGLLAILPLGGAPSNAAEVRPNLLLISIDSLRRDVFDEYVAKHASPTLRRFVVEGRRYRNAHTTFSHSLPSHASMFTGRYPPAHGALLFRQSQENSLGSPLKEGVVTLAETFGDAGYETVAILQNGWVGPPYGLEAGYETYVNYGMAGRIGHYDPWLSMSVPLVGPYVRYVEKRVATEHPDTRLFLRWLTGRSTARPFLAFLHYGEMHTPNLAPASYMERFCSGPFAKLNGFQMNQLFWQEKISAEEMPEALRHLRNLHFANLAQMDEFLSPVLAELMDGGWLDRTLVALVSDHGENLYERAGTYGKSHVYHTSSEVPFVLRVPSEGQGVELRNPVSLVDIASTFYAYAGVTPPAGLQGVNLLAGSPRGPGSDGWVYLRGFDRPNDDWADGVLFADGRKWIRNGAGEGEFYDLGSDPLEEHELSQADEESRRRYQRRFEEALATIGESDATPLTVDQLPDRVADQLRALGYIE